MSEKIHSHHLQRKAILYVRQSSTYQVLHNLESQKPQYAMQEHLRRLGWQEIETINEDLDAWIDSYNHERTHQGKMCCGRTPMATFEDGKRICREKSIA